MGHPVTYKRCAPFTDCQGCYKRQMGIGGFEALAFCFVFFSGKFKLCPLLEGSSGSDVFPSLVIFVDATGRHGRTRKKEGYG